MYFKFCLRSVSLSTDERELTFQGAVFGVNAARCNKPGTVNTFQVQKQISVNMHFVFSLAAHSKLVIISMSA